MIITLFLALIIIFSKEYLLINDNLIIISVFILILTFLISFASSQITDLMYSVRSSYATELAIIVQNELTTEHSLERRSELFINFLFVTEDEEDLH